MASLTMTTSFRTGFAKHSIGTDHPAPAQTHMSGKIGGGTEEGGHLAFRGFFIAALLAIPLWIAVLALANWLMR